MKGSYGEDLASHTDPESCAVARKGGGEALTGPFGETATPMGLQMDSANYWL